jgi:hypothetical protein
VKTQIQQHQYINGLLKKIPSAQPLKAYAEATQVIEAVQLMLQSDFGKIHLPWVESEANRLNTTAWNIAFHRAKIQSRGGSAYRSKGKKSNAKQISIAKYKSLSDKQKAKYEKVSRDGTGQPVEAQRIVEMFLAARHALVLGHNTLTGKYLEPGEKAASAAAAMELRRATQMPLFDDVMKARKFWDNALEAEREELPEVAQDFDPERIGESDSRRPIMASALWEARKRIITYWKSSGSRQWKASWKKDSRLLREVVTGALAGRLFAGKHDSSRRKTLAQLAKRINKPLMANDLQDIIASRRSGKRKPLQTIKLWRGTGVCGWVEYTQPELQTIAKQELVELPLGFRHLAHLRK